MQRLDRMDSFFNSHPAREGDPGRHHNAPAKCDFNSHIPYSKLPIKFFNSRIPVRGATRRDILQNWTCLISTHAPAWSATITMTPPIFSNAEFQLTHPRGVQQDTWSGPRVGGLFQLPHPMWGATRRAAVLVVLRDTFQLTHPCRVRLYRLRRDHAQEIFQLPHPCRVRPGVQLPKRYQMTISIPAPREGL